MVTSAVLFFITNSVLRRIMKYTHAGPVIGIFVWLIFIVIVSAVGMSRCFIATHFPHQVVTGTLSGLFVALFVSRLNVKRYSSVHYILVSLPLLAIVFALNYSLYYFGIDTNWSFKLAVKYCKKKEWIHYNTTVLSAFIRDSASLLGLGYGLEKLKTWSFKPKFTIKYRIFGIITSLLLVRFIERIEIPTSSPAWFYIYFFMKYYTFVYVVITYLNLGVSKSLDLVFGQDQDRDQDQDQKDKKIKSD
ncbi:DgyrCDS12148 [Dimorphilus gyrociliatus]|nr:DgyrCDS12148 [Dimorphilus gyrociliatus]